MDIQEAVEAVVSSAPRIRELLKTDFQEVVALVLELERERDRLLADIDQLTVDNEELASKIHDLELAVRLGSS